MKAAALTRLPVTCLYELPPIDKLHYGWYFESDLNDVCGLHHTNYKRLPVSVFRFSVVAGVAPLFACFLGEVLLVIVQLWGDI